MYCSGICTDVCGACRGQKRRMLDLLELKLQTTVSCRDVGAGNPDLSSPGAGVLHHHDNLNILFLVCGDRFSL